jgi:flagellar basal-body rod protein FlgB
MAIFDAIDRIRASLDYYLARQNVLTANLAHVDTPGYRPLDLERRSFKETLDATLSSDQPGHIHSHARVAYRVFVDRSVSPGLDGNGVSLDREAIKIAANQLRYDAAASLASGQLSSILWAATDARSGG